MTVLDGLVDSGIAVERGCGVRIAGGIYLEAGTERRASGPPLSSYFCDPPIPIDLKALGIAARGSTMINQGGIYHVVDVIGEQFYPIAPDFLWEATQHGISRRIPITATFRNLTPRSRWIGVHARGILSEQRATDLREAGHVLLRPDGESYCPRGETWHPHPDRVVPHCLGLLWEGVPPPSASYRGERRHLRVRPSGAYMAGYLPKGFPLRASAGIICSVPIEKIAVIADAITGKHEAAIRMARTSGLPVTLEQA